MRRFELDGTPRKFWEIRQLAASVEIRWGEIGKPPRVFDRHFETEAEAEVFAERQVIAQRERGYVEIERTMPVVSSELVIERHQRFEWKPQEVRFFVEITQEGVKVTSRGGRVVGDRDVPDRDKFEVQHHPSAASATEAFDERCADLKFQGATVVDPEPTHTISTNAELEADCEASRDDPAPWAVYADWLISHGDARGEIAALHVAGQEARAKRILGTHLVTLCGADTGKLALDYRHGFAVGCTITVELESEELLEEVTQAFLASPMARFIEALRFGLAGIGDENDWAPTIHAVAASPRAGQIRELRFDLYDHEECEISWTPFGDFSGVLPKLPALELLHIKSGAGGILGAIDHPNLRTFVRESGGLAASEIESITSARWPKLEHLAIWFGRDDYGAEGELSAIRPILEGQLALRHLGIVNCEFVDAVIPALACSAILPRLSSLDLSKGAMGREGAAALVADAAAFRHLASIDVSDNMLSHEEAEQIQAALPNTVVGEQRERAGDDDRYAAVGE